jgi:8-oxo-dGTP diphosphatase
VTVVLRSEAFADLTRQAAADGVQQLVVGAIVAGQDGAVLLLKRPATDFMGGIWELPSGKVEPGETLDDALSREVAEETGLTVAGILLYAGSFDYRSGSGKLSRQFNFAVAVAAAGAPEGNGWPVTTGCAPSPAVPLSCNSRERLGVGGVRLLQRQVQTDRQGVSSDRILEAPYCAADVPAQEIRSRPRPPAAC